MKALVRIKEIKRPISEESIGFRLQAAIPNTAGQAYGKEIALFRGAYLISESSDHSMAVLQETFNHVVMNFEADLSRLGFTEFEWRKAV